MVGDRHDAGDHRNRDVGPGTAFEKIEVRVGHVEVLRDCSVGTGIDLAPEGIEVGIRAGGLRVHFGIGGDFKLEAVAMCLADERHQLAGVMEIARCAGADRGGRKIAAQRYDALHAGCLVAVEQRRDPRPRRADAGQVRRGLDAGLFDDLDHGVVGAVLIRAAGTVGH